MCYTEKIDLVSVETDLDALAMACEEVCVASIATYTPCNFFKLLVTSVFLLKAQRSPLPNALQCGAVLHQ